MQFYDFLVSFDVKMNFKNHRTDDTEDELLILKGVSKYRVMSNDIKYATVFI